MNIPDELVGAIHLVLQAYKKVKQIDQEKGNDTLVLNVFEMAELTAASQLLAEHGTGCGGDVQVHAAACAAHVLMLLNNYDETLITKKG